MTMNSTTSRPSLQLRRPNAQRPWAHKVEGFVAILTTRDGGTVGEYKAYDIPNLEPHEAMIIFHVGQNILAVVGDVLLFNTAGSAISISRSVFDDDCWHYHETEGLRLEVRRTLTRKGRIN